MSIKISITKLTFLFYFYGSEYEERRFRTQEMVRQDLRIKEIVKILNVPFVIRSGLDTPLIPDFQLWMSFSCNIYIKINKIKGG